MHVVVGPGQRPGFVGRAPWGRLELLPDSPPSYAGAVAIGPRSRSRSSTDAALLELSWAGGAVEHANLHSALTRDGELHNGIASRLQMFRFALGEVADLREVIAETLAMVDQARR